MRIRFGPFELDDERFQLTRDDRAVALRPKAFDLLTVLVRERERVVRREELFERLWSTTAVGFGSLSGLVNELRSALGECGRGPSSIRTVHARGYQFVAPVTAVGTGDVGGAAAEEEAPKGAELGHCEPVPGWPAAPPGPAAAAHEAADGWLGERLVVALDEVSRAGARALVASIPGPIERSLWLARATRLAIEAGFRPRTAAAQGWESEGPSRRAVRESESEAHGIVATGMTAGRGVRVPIALVVEVEDPGAWGRAGGLRRLLDLVGRAPVLVIAVLAARADEPVARELVARDRRIECVAGLEPTGARDGEGAMATPPPVSDELVRALGALALADHTAFEMALRSMGFEAVRSEPIRTLRRVEPSAREPLRAEPGSRGWGL